MIWLMMLCNIKSPFTKASLNWTSRNINKRGMYTFGVDIKYVSWYYELIINDERLDKRSTKTKR